MKVIPKMILKLKVMMKSEDVEIESNQAKEDPEPEQSIINGNISIFEQINNFFGLKKFSFIKKEGSRLFIFILLSFIFPSKKIVFI